MGYMTCREAQAQITYLRGVFPYYLICIMRTVHPHQSLRGTQEHLVVWAGHLSGGRCQVLVSGTADQADPGAQHGVCTLAMRIRLFVLMSLFPCRGRGALHKILSLPASFLSSWTVRNSIKVCSMAQPTALNPGPKLYLEAEDTIRMVGGAGTAKRPHPLLHP